MEIRQTISASLHRYSDLCFAEACLVRLALQARHNAQAPYSKHPVGAAVQNESYTIFTGCNVERANWSSITHAEQNAIDSMVAETGSSKRITALAIAAAHVDKELTLEYDADLAKPIFERLHFLHQIPAPCGSCLSVIWENCHDDATAVLLSLLPGGLVARTTLASAYPMRFGPRVFGVDYREGRKGSSHDK